MQNNILIFFGPPGSGKGTQADLLSKKIGWRKISIGDLLRTEKKINLSLGIQAKKYMAAGKLVANRLINQIIKKEINRPAKGFILDGYPRNINQLKFLLKVIKPINNKVLRQGGLSKIYSLEIKVSDQEVKQRLGGRRICSSCGAVYHLIYKPAKNNGICDICGNKLLIREDDKPRIIADRLKVYHQEIKPILDYWEKIDKLIKINGEQSINKIHREIMEQLKKFKLI